MTPGGARFPGWRGSLVIHGLVGWAICGATVGVGREFLSMTATLMLHAVVAPVAFGVLAWNHARRYPEPSPAAAALFLVTLVVGLDALVVAPIFERSYEMFRSFVGTWLPLALILAASYFAAWVGRQAPSETR